MDGYYDDEGRYQRGGYDDYDGKGSSSVSTDWFDD